MLVIGTRVRGKVTPYSLYYLLLCCCNLGAGPIPFRIQQMMISGHKVLINSRVGVLVGEEELKE